MGELLLSCLLSGSSQRRSFFLHRRVFPGALLGQGTYGRTSGTGRGIIIKLSGQKRRIYPHTRLRKEII